MTHPDDFDSIIAMADGTLSDTRARLAATDAARVSRVVLEEISARTILFDGPRLPVTVQFELTGTPTPLDFLLTVGTSTPTVRAGRADDAPVVIRQDAAELLRAVYATSAASHDATRAVWIMNEPGVERDVPDDPFLLALKAATLAAGQVVSAASPYRSDLSALARLFGSDKWGDHFYTPHYERHFATLRDERIRLLEIGVGGYESPTAGGESLRMWKYYFRRGLIFGLDVFDKSAVDEGRIRTVVGDQSDPRRLRAVADEIGPLDVVVDDASHLSAHVVTSFTTLFPTLVSGGLYVIEDLQTSYWPGWNGGSTDPNDPATTVGMLKTLIDGLHYQDRLQSTDGPPAPIARNVRAIHLYHNLAIVEKGANEEQTAPSWVPRDSHDMQMEPKGSMRRVNAPLPNSVPGPFAERPGLMQKSSASRNVPASGGKDVDRQRLGQAQASD